MQAHSPYSRPHGPRSSLEEALQPALPERKVRLMEDVHLIQHADRVSVTDDSKNVRAQQTSFHDFRAQTSANSTIAVTLRRRKEWSDRRLRMQGLTAPPD